MNRRTHRYTALAGICALAFVACGTREPQTDADKLARGREIVQKMSDKLASINQMVVTTQETRDIVRHSGKKETVNFSDEIAIRRPDRFHAKITGGTRGLELWYDAKKVTVAAHNDKVFAQAPMPETIDRTLDALAERYGMPLPIADLFYSSAAKALLSDTTTGGYAGREDSGGVSCNHLAFKDTGVEWEIWVPVDGDPLPKRMKVTLKARTGEPVADVPVHELESLARAQRRDICRQSAG